MSNIDHNTYSHKIGQQILISIREQDKKTKQIFSDSITRVGWNGWPQPDFVMADPKINNSTYALEFKPPNKEKREYLTGLGQTVAYLKSHSYVGIILPELSNDNFKIAEFIAETLIIEELNRTPISIFAYDQNTINDSFVKIKLLRGIYKKRESTIDTNLSKANEIFWCWWRENSPSEIFQMLELSEKYSEKIGDIYTEFVWPKFWLKLISGKTKNWEGKSRSISKSNETSHKQNFKIPLNQLNLHNPDDGRITTLGRKFLLIGRHFGKNSSQLKTFLSQLILINGKHLELIKILESFQQNISWPMTSQNFKIEFDRYLIDNGFVKAPEKRKPSAIKTGAKLTYIRDEFKLWNKLGFLVSQNKSRYFDEKIGLTFSVSEITRVLQDDLNFLIDN